VSGNYEGIRKKRRNIQLITGENLIENLSRIFEFATLKVIQNIISNLTNRKPIEISLAYYASKLCFLIGFTENEFSLLNEKGDFLTEEDSLSLNNLIQRNTSYFKYVNLEAEKDALIRKETINKLICSSLLTK